VVSARVLDQSAFDRKKAEPARAEEVPA
jgi:hypothetical protein